MDDTANDLVQPSTHPPSVLALDRLIAEEKEKNPKFRAWLEKKPLCLHTIPDFAQYAPDSFGGIYYHYGGGQPFPC